MLAVPLDCPGSQDWRFPQEIPSAISVVPADLQTGWEALPVTGLMQPCPMDCFRFHQTQKTCQLSDRNHGVIYIRQKEGRLNSSLMNDETYLDNINNYNKLPKLR